MFARDRDALTPGFSRGAVSSDVIVPLASCSAPVTHRAFSWKLKSELYWPSRSPQRPVKSGGRFSSGDWVEVRLMRVMNPPHVHFFSLRSCPPCVC